MIFSVQKAGKTCKRKWNWYIPCAKGRGNLQKVSAKGRWFSREKGSEILQKVSPRDKNLFIKYWKKANNIYKRKVKKQMLLENLLEIPTRTLVGIMLSSERCYYLNWGFIYAFKKALNLAYAKYACLIVCDLMLHLNGYVSCPNFKP